MLFSACKRFEEVPGFSCSKGYSLTIDLTQDLEAIWHSMSRSNRYALKRAVRDGVQVRKSEDYDAFYKIYRPFWKSTKQTGFPEQLKTLKDYGTLFTAEHNNELLGGLVWLEDESTSFGWIMANRRFETTNAKKRKLLSNASRLLLWEAIKDAKERGLAEADLGGVDKEDTLTGYSFFKKRFGGKTEIRYYYRKDYNQILALARKILDLKQR